MISVTVITDALKCPDGSVVRNLPAIQETQVPSVGREDPLEKEMATHSSILAWRIPWTEGTWKTTVHRVAKVSNTTERLTLLLWASQVALVVKDPPAGEGDMWEAGSIPGSGRSPGGGHGNPLQDSCLENPLDRGAWRATVHGVAKSQTRRKWLSTQAACSQRGPVPRT